MLISIIMKTPDCVDYALEDINDEETKASIKKLMNRWFRFGELVTLELDTQAETLIVKEN